MLFLPPVQAAFSPLNWLISTTGLPSPASKLATLAGALRVQLPANRPSGGRRSSAAAPPDRARRMAARQSDSFIDDMSSQARVVPTRGEASSRGLRRAACDEDGARLGQKKSA